MSAAGHDPVERWHLPGTDRPTELHLAPTLDGLYAPYTLQTPADEGVFPVVFLAYGNGGGGIDWLRQWALTRAPISARLLDAGFACVWGRYRTEVELGYNRGGPLVTETRSGMDLLSRGPLEYEDEVAILRHVAADPRVDAGRLGHVGVSHAGEMLFKLASDYPGLLRAGVACEPANHEFLGLAAQPAAPDTQHVMRDVEHLQAADTTDVRSRTNLDLVRTRLAPIDLPILVMGRDGDHLQGIFRVSYDLLVEAGKPAQWVSFRHDVHGYLFPTCDERGVAQIDSVQNEAIGTVIDFLAAELGVDAG